MNGEAGVTNTMLCTKLLALFLVASVAHMKGAAHSYRALPAEPAQLKPAPVEESGACIAALDVGWKHACYKPETRKDDVTSDKVFYSPNGSRVANFDQDDQGLPLVAITDSATTTRFKALPVTYTHTKALWSCDGGHVATTFDVGTCSVFEVDSAKTSPIFTSDKRGLTAWSPVHDAILARADDGSSYIDLIDVRMGKAVKTIRRCEDAGLHGTAALLVWPTRKLMVAVSSMLRYVEGWCGCSETAKKPSWTLYNPDSGEHLLSIEKTHPTGDGYRAAAISPDGKLGAFIESDGVVVYDLKQSIDNLGSVRRAPLNYEAVDVFWLSPTVLCIQAKRKAHIIDTDNNKVLHTIRAKNSWYIPKTNELLFTQRALSESAAAGDSRALVLMSWKPEMPAPAPAAAALPVAERKGE